jgi:hypothetical protein
MKSVSLLLKILLYLYRKAAYNSDRYMSDNKKSERDEPQDNNKEIYYEI